MAGAVMFSTIVYLPFYMQIVHGEGAGTAGLLLVPMMVGIVAAGVVGGRVFSRTGRYKAFPLLGLAMAGLAL